MATATIKPAYADIAADQKSARILDAKWDGHSTFTVPEAGKICRMSRPSAYAAAKSGQLPVIRIGRRLIVPRHALEKLLGA